MKPLFRSWFRARQSRIERRLDHTRDTATHRPVLSARAIDYDVSRRDRAIAHGGIGLIHTLARKVGLPRAIDDRLHLLERHVPYHESDRVLNIAYNALCHGTCLQDIDLRRHDDAFLDALGARRLPDPTTAGDFCRRFTAADLGTLQDAIDVARRAVWAAQPASFFDRAALDMDGTLVATTGACKAGTDIAYDGAWGHHPLVVTLAETGAVLRLVNRPGNRPSHEGAAGQVDRAIWLCLWAGFRRAVLRGDTDFSQTAHLDRWHDLPWVRFVSGYDARPNLQAKAEDLPASTWPPLRRPPRYDVKAQPRRRPAAVKDRIVRDRGFEVLRLQSEEVAEFEYRPTACANTSRMVVVRKHISREKGERALFPEVRYFFYLTNDRDLTAEEVVFEANARRDRENLLAQLHGGTHALTAPVDALAGNGTWMVMAVPAWTLKAWWALLLPEAPGRWQVEHRAEKRRVLRTEFKASVNAFVTIPRQVLRTGRRRVLRLLGWNPHLLTFFRLVSRLRE